MIINCEELELLVKRSEPNCCHVPSSHVPIATTLAVAKLARSNKVIETLLLGSSIIDRTANNVAARVNVGVKLYDSVQVIREHTAKRP